jgi:hypothetical protein
MRTIENDRICIEFVVDDISSERKRNIFQKKRGQIEQ